jgi:uncharacterized SAM-binding protein YcdF (DUF218 family)
MFVLLKILLYFFRPLTWIIIVFITGFITKRPGLKRKCFIAAFILLLFFSNPFIINNLIAAHEEAPRELTQPAETAILLGGFVGYNKKDDKGYLNASADRLIQTALLYKTGRVKNILVTAGNGYIINHHFVEADFAKELLISLGVPAEHIITEGRSKNTEENALYSKKIIDSLKMPGSLVLVTSAFHMPRAMLAFKKAGIHTIPYPCDFISKQVGNNFFEDYILPSSTALRNWDLYIKEMVGIAVYKMKK